jgi:predicted NAD/FAD-binding protein
VIAHGLWQIMNLRRKYRFDAGRPLTRVVETTQAATEEQYMDDVTKKLDDTANQLDDVCHLRALIDGTVLKMVERDPDVREHVVTATMLKHFMLNPEPNGDADTLLKNLIESVARAQYYERAFRRVLKELPPEVARAYSWKGLNA